MGAVKIGGEYNIQENADNIIDNKKIGNPFMEIIH